jgi:hypothetical protein
MATLEELEALREKPEQQMEPVVAAPASPQIPQGPTLAELAASTNPTLNTSLDQRSRLDRNLDFVDSFKPGAYYGATGHETRSPSEVEFDESMRKIGSADTATSFNAFADLQDRTSFGKGFTRGAVNVALDTIQAPGNLAKAFHEVDFLDDNGAKFDYSWDKPLSSLLWGVTDITQRLQDELNADVRADRSLLEKFPEALGSATAFLAGGAASGAKTLWGQAGVSGGLGAASSASSQYEEALAYGANPEDALLAYGGGAALGATEGFPGFFFLKRLNALGGGKVMEKLNALGMQGESGTVREAVKGALTEMTQEGTQTVGSNWVASDLAAYDPSRSLGENFWDNVITAGLTGSMLGGGMQMIRETELKEAKIQLDAEYKRRMESGDTINALATPGNGFGSFTPVENLVQLNKIKADLDRHIDQKAEAAYARMAEQVDKNNGTAIEFPNDPFGVPDEIIPDNQAQAMETVDEGEKRFNDYVGTETTVNTHTEAALFEKGRTEPMSVAQTDRAGY